MKTNSRIHFYALILAAFCFFSLSISAQDDDAKNKEIDKLFESGYAKIFDKNYAGAVEDFKKAVELDPSVANSYFSLGRAYIDNKEYDKGLAEFEKYKEIFTDKDEGADAWIAEAYFKKGDTEQALDLLNEKLSESENSAVLREKRAEIYAATGQIDEAIEDYSKAIDYYDAPGLLYARAGLYKKKGEKRLALKDLLSILRKFPDYEKLRAETLNLGAAENDLPKRIAPANEKPNAQAKELFQKAFDGLIENGKDAGIYHLEKVAKTDAKFATPFYYLGSIYESQVLSGSAMRNLEKAEKINPGFIEAFQKHADILRINGGADKAILKYNQILKINPKYSPAYVGRGRIFEDQAYNEEKKTLKAALEKKALLEYDKAIQFDPQNSTALYNRGTLYLGQNKFDPAIKDLTDAIKFNDEDYMLGSIYSSRARAYCKSGKKDLAKTDEQKATELGGYISEPCQ